MELWELLILLSFHANVCTWQLGRSIRSIENNRPNELNYKLEERAKVLQSVIAHKLN